ncbi:hypothetical protein UA08_07412 [Talaromyces atroroseus]|uniref:FAS1 domain-containing protein n=1 Tax=Talaromyces atroroseus TaxID=1441469 RepID=A0A225AN96_TALAT|nr:hypothetical protein UA08_07412 [Talaromyces atroroseus]OKL57069.1 hypothetical protein UA08_07412 [Talaromyces atroroseus]
MKFMKLSLLASMPGAIMAQNLTQLLSNTTQLSSLNTLLSSYPTIVNSLGNITNVTILAPSNNALSNLTDSRGLEALASTNNRSVIDLLSYHILRGEYYDSNITQTPVFIPTYLNDSVVTNVTGGQVVEAIKQDNDTYFFSGLFSNSTVTQANLNFTGGVLHIIDKVLSIPSNVTYSAATAGLSAVVGALRADNLTDSVDTTPNVTVFAPENSAFQAIGSALGNFTTDQLTGVLDYHVINGQVAYSTNLTNGTQFTAVNGRNLTVRVENGSIFVDSARVTRPNLLVANGVLHVIDNVLNPNNTSATPNATATSQVPAFSGASSASSIPFTSGVTASATATGSGAGAGAGVTGTSGASGTSTSSAAAMPMRTGGLGAAVVVGAGAALLNADIF